MNRWSKCYWNKDQDRWFKVLTWSLQLALPISACPAHFSLSHPFQLGPPISACPAHFSVSCPLQLAPPISACPAHFSLSRPFQLAPPISTCPAHFASCNWTVTGSSHWRWITPGIFVIKTAFLMGFSFFFLMKSSKHLCSLQLRPFIETLQEATTLNHTNTTEKTN